MLGERVVVLPASGAGGRARAALDAEPDERVARAAETGEDAIDLAQALSTLAGDRRRIERELDEASRTIGELDARRFFTPPTGAALGIMERPHQGPVVAGGGVAVSRSARSS